MAKIKNKFCKQIILARKTSGKDTEKNNLSNLNKILETTKKSANSKVSASSLNENEIFVKGYILLSTKLDNTWFT